MKNIFAGAVCSLFAAGMLYGNVAFAEDATVCDFDTNCTIDRIRITSANNLALINADAAVAGPALCSVNMAIAVDTENGKAMYSAALTAKATGNPVFIGISDDTRFNGDQCLITDFRLL